MKPVSRGERGRRISKAFGGTKFIKEIASAKNPLKGEYKKFASAEVSLKGAGLFVGFSIKF